MTDDDSGLRLGRFFNRPPSSSPAIVNRIAENRRDGKLGRFFNRPPASSPAIVNRIIENRKDGER